jgi:hypothetical protein
MNSPAPSYYMLSSQDPPRRPFLWLVGGLVLGVVLTLAAQVLAAPRALSLDPPSSNGDVSITIDDNFVAQQATRGVARVHLPLTVSNLQAHINPGNTISISGTGAFGLLSGTFAATTQVTVSNGELVSHLTSAELGSAVLPAPVTAGLDAAINGQLDATVARLLPSSTGLALSSITTTDGKLTLLITQQS